MENREFITEILYWLGIVLICMLVAGMFIHMKEEAINAQIPNTQETQDY